MERIFKVFCTGADQERLAEKYSLIERYQGFILAKIPEDKVNQIIKQYPTEDITELYTVRVGSREIDTSLPRVNTEGKSLPHPAYKAVASLSPGRHHYIVQFVGPIKKEWLSAVEAAGCNVRAPLEAFSIVVRANEKAVTRTVKLPFVRWVGHLPHESRISPSVFAHIDRKSTEVTSDLPRTRVIPQTYTIEFFDSADIKAAVAKIGKLGFDVLEKSHEGKLIIVRDAKGGRGAQKRIRDLSAVHGVRLIRERSLKRTANDVAVRIMGTNFAMSASHLGLSGEGEIIGVCDTGIDTGNPQTVHSDFAGRIISMVSYPISSDFSSDVNNPGDDDGAADLDSGHGTHVAGSILGNGTGSTNNNGGNGPIRGLAYKAKLVFQAVEQEMRWKDPVYRTKYGRYILAGIPLDLTELFIEAYEKGARIHSNSWGGGDPGAYDVQCEQLDRFVWNHKDFCILFANGNDGTDEDGDGSINLKSVTSPATAKNCISVGASENERPDFNAATYGAWWRQDYPVAPYRADPMADNPEQIAAFSSRGPTQDGRVKPEIVAPGTFILSTRSTMIAANNLGWAAFPDNKLYFYMGGTSMATPLTAGAVALIREYLRKVRRISSPSAALLKATLITGAKRLPGYGSEGGLFDNDQGYGLVNLDGVLAPSPPAQAEFLEVKPGLQTGEVYSTQIDVASGQVPLRMTLAYSDYPGPALVNNLNLILTAPNGTRYIGNGSTGELLTMDSKNNVEVVHIERPMPGKWSVEVIGSNIPREPQDFVLVYIAHVGETSTDAFVYVESTPGLPIPDNSPPGVSDVLSVTRQGKISNVKVGVDIEHSYIGDLKVLLTASNGTKVMLHDRKGASANDLIKTYDVHSTPELTTLNGLPIQGDWRLSVSDHAAIDEGRLRRWHLEIGLEPTNVIHREKEAFLQIPDNDPNGISTSMDVEETGKVRDIKVSVDITHNWIGDLVITLIAPSGNRVLLHNRSGGGQDNIIKTYDAANLTALQTLYGLDIKGTWTLKASDNAGRDVGKLNRWALDIAV